MGREDNVNHPARPPQHVLKFFRWFCHPSLQSSIEGDLVELFTERLTTNGKRKANIAFVVDVILLFRPGIIRPAEGLQTLNQYGMLKSYFKIGWRNLVKSKVYSFINIGGLATGMAAAVLIGLWLHDELTFNQNFKNYDRIARVVQNQEFNGVTETWFSQAMQLGPELRDTYGNNFKHVVITAWPNKHKLTYNTKAVQLTGNFMEPGITQMLDLKMINGVQDGLKDPHSVMLSVSAAKAIFGNEDAIDKSLRVDNKHDVKVTGVYEDLAPNSDFGNLAFILPFELDVKENLPTWVSWGNSWFQCFVQLEDNVEMTTASLNIRDAKLKRLQGLGLDDTRFKPVVFLHPMKDWRLYSKFENGVSAGGAIRDVWMFGTIGFFVLLLACINFMNLSTARAERRAKEVGIRKTIGSLQRQLVKQFYVESFIVVTIAMVISVLLAALALPWFNSVSRKLIEIPWGNPGLWISIVGFVLVIGFVSGSYPAFYLSSFKPVKALKGGMKVGRSSTLPRKIMVVIQFSISVVLITATFVIMDQINYAQNRPLGYDTNGIIISPIRNNNIKDHFDSFGNELRASGAIAEVALSDTEVTNTGITNSGFHWSGKPSDMQDEFWTLRVTPDFGKLTNWQLIEGRDFLPTDTAAFIINETAVKYMNLESPVGEVIRWGDNEEYRIIGVVKDMVTNSPYSPVRQMIFVSPKELEFISLVNIRINPDMSTQEALSKIEMIFKKYDPENPFEYTFADDNYAQKFNNEKIIAQLCSALAILAIFICSLGLFGLASFMAEQRTKEIGIRKVLGASTTSLWQIMSGDFVILVVIASGIALPPAYYLSANWLSQFEYRVPLSWMIFAAAIGGALLIALLTVSYHAIRSAMSNPINSLRSE